MAFFWLSFATPAGFFNDFGRKKGMPDGIGVSFPYRLAFSPPIRVVARPSNWHHAVKGEDSPIIVLSLETVVSKHPMASFPLAARLILCHHSILHFFVCTRGTSDLF